ncbi:CsbD family protein [Nocardioides sp. NPDC127503]|uniref:CsbD family protein n=1 Tax=Nocardioides sp. NPDC127503 TaxID=3154516 RepID=UPI00331FDFE2
MSMIDKAKNAAKGAFGKAKVVAGKTTNDHSLKAEGKMDQAKASAKNTVEGVKDKFKK